MLWMGADKVYTKSARYKNLQAKKRQQQLAAANDDLED